MEDDTYRDDTGAYIELFFEQLDNTQAYVYQGQDRANFTEFIQGNSTAVVGVPYRVGISEKLIVVMM